MAMTLTRNDLVGRKIKECLLGPWERNSAPYNVAFQPVIIVIDSGKAFSLDHTTGCDPMSEEYFRSAEIPTTIQWKPSFRRELGNVTIAEIAVNPSHLSPCLLLDSGFAVYHNDDGYPGQFTLVVRPIEIEELQLEFLTFWGHRRFEREHGFAG